MWPGRINKSLNAKCPLLIWLKLGSSWKTLCSYLVGGAICPSAIAHLHSSWGHSCKSNLEEALSAHRLRPKGQHFRKSPLQASMSSHCCLAAIGLLRAFPLCLGRFGFWSGCGTSPDASLSSRWFALAGSFRCIESVRIGTLRLPRCNASFCRKFCPSKGWSRVCLLSLLTHKFLNLTERHLVGPIYMQPLRSSDLQIQDGNFCWFLKPSYIGQDCLCSSLPSTQFDRAWNELLLFRLNYHFIGDPCTQPCPNR